MSEAGQQEHWTARFGKPILFSVIAIAVGGAYLATTVPISVFPETNFPRIIVGIDNGVMPINQMEVTITRPIEEAVNTVPGLERVVSTTSRGSAEVNLFFNWSVNMFQTLDLVNAALGRVQTGLPSTAKLTANRLTFAAFPILGYSMTSNSVPQTTLWELATYQVKPRLNRLMGVSNVVVQGGEVPEFDVVPDPGKLVETGITVPGILDAIARGNFLDSPGFVERRHQLVLGVVSGQVTNPDEIGQLALKTAPNGVPVRIADVASVDRATAPKYTIVTANGRPAVLLNILRQPSSNTVTVADEVDGELKAIRQTLPAGVTIQSFYDQSGLVKASIASVRDAILIGLVLAAIIMALFLRDWGTSGVAALVIPVTIAITCIALRVFGQSFNLMTLGGMAAAVGLVIDDAIVVVENISLHRARGQDRGEAIRSAINEIRMPLLGSTITPIVVFLPLIGVTGVTGTFFRALAITVAVSLLTSLALALTWTPALSQYLMRAKPREDEKRALGVQTYDRSIQLLLRAPWLLIVAGIVLAVASFLCFRSIGSDLLPGIDEGGFVFDYLMPAGSSLQDTNRVITGVEKLIAEIPEVESISRRTGLQLGLAAVTEANNGDISVKLKAKRHRSVDQVMAEVRKKVGDEYPQLDIDLNQVLQDMIGDLTSSPDPIQVKLFHPDINLLKLWAPRVADAVKKQPGVVDIHNGIENTISGPGLMWRLDPATIVRAGFTPQEVELDASAVLDGEPATTPVVVNDHTYTLRVRFPERTRTSLEAIQNTLLVSGAGKTANLGSLAAVETLPGQNEVLRENLLRDVAVTGRFEGVNLGKGIEEVKRAVAGVHVPPAIRVVYGGLYAEQQKSFHDLVIVLVLAVALVFTVLLVEFRTFAAPIAILSSALLSTSGVFFALFITGMTFNLSSFMGLIMVIGIVAKNGILLLDAEQRFRGEGTDARTAMIRAGERRLRPILMTALATTAGMIPLSLALGAGSQMLQPLAIAVIGGIAASMVLSLIVTPTVHYYLMGRAK